MIHTRRIAPRIWFRISLIGKLANNAHIYSDLPYRRDITMTMVCICTPPDTAAVCLQLAYVVLKCSRWLTCGSTNLVDRHLNVIYDEEMRDPLLRLFARSSQ